MHPFGNFSSNQYWTQSTEKTQSPEKIVQKFYVTLCLFISAASDFAVGLDLRDNKKLNWSVTASYYSIVHSTRMIVFAAVGDYPKGHSVLANLFSGGQGISPNWLGEWLRRFDTPGFERYNRVGPRARFTLDELSHYYREELNFHDSDKYFRAIGNIFKNARILRNDSNYESLLIAHEYHHEKVTEYFEKLSQEMSKGAGICLEVAAKCFQSYVENDATLEKNRQAFKYLTERYIQKRIYDSVRERNEESILERVKGYVNPLEEIFSGQQQKLEISEVEKRYLQLESWVSLSGFSEKTNMITDFKNKIDTLRENIEMVDKNIR